MTLKQRTCSMDMDSSGGRLVVGSAANISDTARQGPGITKFFVHFSAQVVHAKVVSVASSGGFCH